VCVDHVSFQKLSSAENGVKHSGDSRTGGATCDDDETIQVQLSKVRQEVQRIVFVAHVFTDGCSFAKVSNGSCRVMDADRELCRYSLSDYGDENGLVIASLHRAQGRWEFHAIGRPCRGRKWKDSLPQIEQICFDGATENRDADVVGAESATPCKKRPLDDASLAENKPANAKMKIARTAADESEPKKTAGPGASDTKEEEVRAAREEQKKREEAREEQMKLAVELRRPLASTPCS